DPDRGVARSGLPSRLKSPAAIDSPPVGLGIGEPVAGATPPLVFPSTIDNSVPLVVARSSFPSRLKSALVMPLSPEPKGEPVTVLKLIPPHGCALHVFSSIETVFAL